MSEVQQVRGKISTVEWILALLACLSVILLFIPSDLIKFEKTIVAKDYQSHLYSDLNQGGQSQVRWLDKEQQRWQCELSEAHVSPYCSVQLDVVNEDGHGIDLSGFDKMTIWASYQGEAEYLRVYIRNRNPKYFVLGDITSTKYNIVEIPVDQLSQNGLTIEMKNLSVADWWLTSHKIPLALSNTEFNDVLYIEIQTGSQTRQGLHQVQLQKIVWEGSWLTQAALYKIIIVTWVVCILSLLIYRIVTLNLQLKKNQRYQDELLSINELLSLKNKKIEDLANTDQLTGLLNRLGIREALYNGLKDWKTNRQPFTFVLMDIDHFKKLNDSFGHDAGDLVLQHTAQRLSDNIRRTDFLARWGGEEFILVCPNTNLDDAMIVAEQLREHLASMVITEIPNIGSITASFGVSTMTTPDLKALFKDADDALYQAKEQGRNKVVSSL
ncbi:GGDEF domain-containing protein [Alteromonadaceae bacterium BrNp21-10]|nr:GGDEF domain-containing protein [Alteromonadaceae bacterium BrNp21-10]